MSLRSPARVPARAQPLLRERHERDPIVRVVEHHAEGRQELLPDVADRVQVGEGSALGQGELDLALLEAVAGELEPRQASVLGLGQTADAAAGTARDRAALEE